MERQKALNYLKEAKIAFNLAETSVQKKALVDQIKAFDAYRNALEAIYPRIDGGPKVIFQKEAPQKKEKLSDDEIGKLLATVDVVIKKINSKEKPITTTEQNEDIAVAMTGHLLAFAERHPSIRLNQLIPTKISSSNNQNTLEDDYRNDILAKDNKPLTRYHLLKILLKQDATRKISDINNALYKRYHRFSYDQDPQALSGHYNQLLNADIISFEPLPNGQNVSYIKTDKRSTIFVNRGITITSLVNKILQSAEKPFTVSEIQTRLIDTLPAYTEQDTETLKNEIAQSAKYLVKNGYIKRKNTKPLNKNSRIYLAKDQQSMVNDYVNTLRTLSKLDPEFLAEGKKLAYEIARDPKRLDLIINKKSEKQIQIRKMNIEETTKQIVSFLNENPRRTVDDITTFLENMFGSNYNQQIFKSSTEGLIKKGKISVSQDKENLFLSIKQ